MSDEEQQTKNMGGRPSKYDPGFCDLAYEQMKLGFSKTATAGYLGIARSTLHQWSDDHPEFSDAIKLGEAARTLKLETDLLSAADGPTVTSRIFALKNAAPDEWRDKREHEVKGQMALTPTINYNGKSE